MSDTFEDSKPEKVRAGYDAVAGKYDEQFANELDHKPLERALLGAMCELTAHGTLADIGCGPGHVSRFLAQRHQHVVGIDISAKMIKLAQTRNPRLEFNVASMLDLPFANDSWTGVVALYSIIHFNAHQRFRAFTELSRTLQPNGWLLLSFHVEGSGFAPGDVNHLRTFLGHPVEMDAYFLDPPTVVADLTAIGFRVTARVDREPIPEVEFPSRRCYLLAQNRMQRGSLQDFTRNPVPQLFGG